MIKIMDEKLFCSAVIVAAGSGKRMGTDKPKQFLELCGKTIIERTVGIFAGCNFINEIIVVSSEDGIGKCKKLLDVKGIKYVLGGSERYESVYNGLKSVSENSDIVIIHDGVRPFVTENIIRESVLSAIEYGACAAGVKSKDTVKICDADGFVKETPDRSMVYSIQTPQTFRRSIISDAYQKACLSGVFGTDDASLAENAGYRVKIIEGSYENIKITTPDDLIVGEKLLKGGGDDKNS